MKITDEMVKQFRTEWLAADDEGDHGRRVRRGLSAALQTDTPEPIYVYTVGILEPDRDVYPDGEGETFDIDKARRWVAEALEVFSNATLIRRRLHEWEPAETSDHEVGGTDV